MAKMYSVTIVTIQKYLAIDSINLPHMLQGTITTKIIRRLKNVAHSGQLLSNVL